MSDLRADPLSPLDAATLWPQLGRLATEVVAMNSAENVFVASTLAATGITHLPRMPRTVVVGIRRGLTYRGILVGRELDGGAAWEVVSLRLRRDKDDDVVTALLTGTGLEMARRGGRTLFLRAPEGSPHTQALHRGGLLSFREELLYAIRGRDSSIVESPFRPMTRPDRPGVFRLYCRAVPQHVRRIEAPTQQGWRAVIGAYDCDREFVATGEKGVIAWAGFGPRECRLLIDSTLAGLAETALTLVEGQASRHGTLVLDLEQSDLQHIAAERGYTALGVRLVFARQLAALNPLKEMVAVQAEIARPR